MIVLPSLKIPAGHIKSTFQPSLNVLIGILILTYLSVLVGSLVWTYFSEIWTNFHKSDRRFEPRSIFQYLEWFTIWKIFYDFGSILKNPDWFPEILQNSKNKSNFRKPWIWPNKSKRNTSIGWTHYWQVFLFASHLLISYDLV